MLYPQGLVRHQASSFAHGCLLRPHGMVHGRTLERPKLLSSFFRGPQSFHNLRGMLR